jgi:hypothetical protein
MLVRSALDGSSGYHAAIVWSSVHVERPSFAEVGGQSSSTAIVSVSLDVIVLASGNAAGDLGCDVAAVPDPEGSVSAALDASWSIETISSHAGRSQSDREP